MKVYLGGDRVLTGSARLAQEAQERTATTLRTQEHQGRLRRLAVRRKAIDAQIVALRAEAESEAEELHLAMAQETLRDQTVSLDAGIMAQQRRGANGSNGRMKERR